MHTAQSTKMNLSSFPSNMRERAAAFDREWAFLGGRTKGRERGWARHHHQQQKNKKKQKKKKKKKKKKKMKKLKGRGLWS